MFAKAEPPGCTSIADLSEFLDIPESRTAKAVFMVGTIAGEERFVFAVVRGDHELNEAKLAGSVGASELRPATEEEIRGIGAEPGYGSPIGVDEEVLIVVDDLVAASPNLVAGANRVDAHYLNVNAGRDYEPDVVADLGAAEDGMPCAECGAPLRSERGIELGNIFKLGTKYSASLGATFLDASGKPRPVAMGCYGIGVDRLLACTIEAHHDEAGILWPVSIAPFQAHIVVLHAKRSEGEGEAAEKISRDLEAAGVEVLIDDRDERAGVKFTDADLIGIPVRLTVSAQKLAGGQVEVKRRRDPREARVDVALEDVVAYVKAKLAEMEEESDVG